MNNGIIFVAGAAVGAVASYFIFKGKFQKDADQQITEVKAKMSEIKSSNDILKEAKNKADANYNKPVDMIAGDLAEEEHEVTEGIDYASYSKKNRQSKQVSDVIHIISQHEYYDYVEKKKFDEKLFTFYQGDSQLVDDETELTVANPELFVGPNGVDAMIGSTVEETYFLDEKNKTVCTVTISEDSYELESDESLVNIE